MKRLLVILALVLVPTALFAQADRVSNKDLEELLAARLA